MPKVRVAAFSIAIDGYGAGPGQDRENPMGVGGMVLHQWAFRTRTFHRMFGQEGGSDGPDDAWAARSFAQVGAWILGRNMFGPVRGPWPDESWRGWWGEEPPYHVPVFVLTHHPRPDLVMAGGTTFHFVTGGPAEALERARKAAKGLDVRVGGGVATVRQYLQLGLLDELHLVQSPVLLGRGEHLFQGLDLAALGYRCARQETPEAATHLLLERGGASCRDR